jgi:hypothetical protein
LSDSRGTSRRFSLDLFPPALRSSSISRLRIPFIKSILFTALLLIGCDLNGDPSQRFLQKTLGFSLDDFATSIVTTKDGGFIITGRSNSPRNNTDILLVRTDRNFRPIWSKTLGGSGLDQGYAAIELADGSVAVLGTIDTDGGDTDLFLARIDADSRIRWSRHFGGEGDDDGRSLIILEDQSLMIAGTYDQGSNNTDLWLLKINDRGDSMTSRIVDVRGGDRARSIAACLDGGFIVAAQVEGLDSVKFVHSLLRFDANANELWRQTYSGINRDEPAQVIPTSDGGFALVGSTNFKPIFRPPQIATTLIKTDGSGNLQWYYEYRLNPNDEGFSLVEVPEGGFLLTGTALTDFYASDNQLALLRTDAAGNLLWVRYYGGSDTESGQSIVRIEGGYAIAGYTQSFGSGQSDVYCLKVNDDGRLDE